LSAEEIAEIEHGTNFPSHPDPQPTKGHTAATKFLGTVSPDRLSALTEVGHAKCQFEQLFDEFDVVEKWRG
jgi:hypothetical protein